MGVLKATIGSTDVTQYLKGFRASPGGDGRVGTATLELDKQAAGLDIRPMMVVQVWESFDGAGAGVADRGRFFGGLVRNRDTSNIGTTKTWGLSCDDFNIIGTRGLIRDMAAAKAITLTAGTAADQVAELTQIIQRNGAITVNTEIDATTAVQAAFAGVNLPGVIYEGGHTYYWYLGQICAAIVVEAPTMRPTYYLGTSITVGGSEDFGPPTLYLIDKANPTSPAFVFTDVYPAPGGEHNMFAFRRASQSNEIVQRIQTRTPTQVLTGENPTAQDTYPNPYINHGGDDDTGYWMDEPLRTDVTDNTQAQALVDRRVESGGYPRESYLLETDQRLRNGEYVEITHSLEGLANVVLQVVETEYRIDPTLEVWVRATLNARRLKIGDSAEDDIYAPPVEGDIVPPLPPQNFALVSNVYNPATGHSELTFEWDASPSADTALYQILAYASGGYSPVWEGDNTTDEATIEWEPGATYEIRARAVDSTGNIGLMTDPALTGTAAVEAWPGLANPSFDYLDRLDLTRPRYWDRALVGDGAAFVDDTTQVHGPRSLQLATFGGPTDSGGVESELFVAEGLDSFPYSLSLFAKASVAGETLEWRVRQHLADGSPDVTRATSGSFTLTTDWAEYGTDLTMFGDAPYMKLKLSMTSTASRQVWVDAVSMEPQIAETGLRDESVTPDKIQPSATDGDVLVTSGGVVVWDAPGGGGGGGATVMATLNYIIDGQGSVISTGAYPPFQFDFAGTIQSVTLLGDAVNVGSVVLDIWSDAYGNYPPTVADSITAAAKPTLSSATKYQDSTLTGWDTSIAAGDSWIINVDSASTLTYVTLSVKIQRSSGGGTGAAALDDLTDVSITTPASGEVLTYNGTEWVNDTAAGGGATDLDDLTDVVITAPATDDVLVYNGTNWVNDTAPGGGGGGDSTHTAAYASRPAASNAGDLFLPSDGMVIERDTGAAWVPWGPLFSLTTPDDSAFAWINQGGASTTTTRGGVVLTVPATAGNYRIRKKARPSAPPWTVRAALLPNIGHGGNSGFSLIARESSTGKFVDYEFRFNSNQFRVGVWYWNSPSSFNSGGITEIVQANPIGPPFFLKMDDDGTNLKFSLSVNGLDGNFYTVASLGRTAFLAGGADEVGYAGRCESGNDIYITLLSWEDA